MKWISLFGCILFPLFSSATTLRMEGERAWLTADGAPLAKVLHLFEQRGVEVLIDPSLELGRVSGEWENTKVDRLIAQLASPNNYLLEWKRMSGPLGSLDQLSSIRIFSDRAASARRISTCRKVLDVVEGQNGIKYVRGEIMVGFKEGSSIEDLNALLTKLGGTVIEVLNPPGIYRIKLNDDLSVEKAMEIANAHEGVDSSEPNLAFPKIGTSQVSLSGNHSGINMNLQPGETAVAVFDSGLDPKYADLPYLRGSYNALDPSEAMSDPLGHGTLVALIASGAITPLGGKASDTGVPVLVVRVFDENGYTSSDVLMRAIDYALNSGVEIINLSFGTYDEVGFLEHAVNYAVQQGITIVVAAGNDQLEKSVNPAANPATISVGAKDPDGSIADYSNRGATVTDYEYGSVMLEGKRHDGSSFGAPFWAHKFAVQFSN